MSPFTRSSFNSFFVLCYFLIAHNLVAQVPPGQNLIQQPWHMHHVNNDYLIANSLNAADVDQDGEDDYAVIDEYKGLQTIIFYPNSVTQIREPWERLNLGETNNPEYSCLGDVDGDGNIDFVVVTGDDLEKGFKTGVGVIWAPDKGKVRDSTAWINGGYIPATLGQQYLYAQCHDVDEDGALDIVVGGRRNALTGEYAGLRWLKGPANIEDRRDLSLWKSYYIDKDAFSGHGFVFCDVDTDGYEDIVLADADWDTPAHQRKIYWYRNPGNASRIGQAWEAHLIWKSAAFYAKPQIAVGDLNGDGLIDLGTQTQNFIHLFIKELEGKEVKWNHMRIKKPELVQWIGRPIKFADLDNDGKLNIVGMLIHNDGYLPAGKASVFWLSFQDEKPTDQWIFYTLKWSDGYNSYAPWIGEKWDHCLVRDVDHDGDLDLVGNVEEHFYSPTGERKDRTSFFSVVWFENPLN